MTTYEVELGSVISPMLSALPGHCSLREPVDLYKIKLVKLPGKRVFDEISSEQTKKQMCLTSLLLAPLDAFPSPPTLAKFKHIRLESPPSPLLLSSVAPSPPSPSSRSSPSSSSSPIPLSPAPLSPEPLSPSANTSPERKRFKPELLQIPNEDTHMSQLTLAPLNSIFPHSTTDASAFLSISAITSPVDLPPLNSIFRFEPYSQNVEQEPTPLSPCSRPDTPISPLHSPISIPSPASPLSTKSRASPCSPSGMDAHDQLLVPIHQTPKGAHKRTDFNMNTTIASRPGLRKGRIATRPQERLVLEEYYVSFFQHNPRREREKIEELESRLGWDIPRIQRWLDNRRTKDRIEHTISKSGTRAQAV